MINTLASYIIVLITAVAGLDFRTLAATAYLNTVLITVNTGP